MIVPTFGRPQYLSDAIESVLSQTVGDFELIVVDDCSPEPVEVDTADPRVRVVRSPRNVGPGGARNLGVEEANGSHLVFLDDDDAWLSRRLEFAEAGLARAPIAICWQNADGGGRHLEGNVFDVILDEEPPQLGAVAVQRDHWRPMDPSYRRGQDIVWWMTVSRRTEVTTVAERGVMIRKRPDKSSREELQKRLDTNYRILREFSPYFDSHDRARAYRWRKIAAWERKQGRRGAAATAYRRSLSAHWDWKVVKMAARSVLP